MSRGVLKWLARFVGLAPAEQTSGEPESRLDKARETLNDAIARYDRSLAARGSLCETLRGQIRALETEHARLSSALEVHAKLPTPGPETSELALRWQTAGDDLAALREQLQEAEVRFAELSAAREQAIEAARKKWAEFKLHADPQESRPIAPGDNPSPGRHRKQQISPFLPLPGLDQNPSRIL